MSDTYTEFMATYAKDRLVVHVTPGGVQESAGWPAAPMIAMLVGEQVAS